MTFVNAHIYEYFTNIFTVSIGHCGGTKMINVVAYLYSNKNNWILYEVVVLSFCCHGLFALRCIISVALNGASRCK